MIVLDNNPVIVALFASGEYWGRGGGDIQGTPNGNPMETNPWGFAKVNSLNREKEALEQSVAQVRVTNGRFFPLRSLAAVKHTSDDEKTP